MIVCHCRNITDRDIDAAIDWMRASDPGAVITPGKIRRVLGRSAACGSCMPLLVKVMSRNENLAVALVRSDAGSQQRKEKHS